MKKYLLMAFCAFFMSCGGAAVTTNSAVDSASGEETTSEASSEAASVPNADFRTFWGNLKNAIASNDVAALKALTKVPVTVRGTLDDSPETAVGDEKIDLVLAESLKQPVGDDGVTPTHKFVKNLKDEEKQLKEAESSKRFLDYVLELSPDKGWQIVYIYLQDDSMKAAGLPNE